MANNHKSTILIVDDRPANILALEKLLEKNDRVFINAITGQDALKIALNKEIDLIILDVQMPGMDGFEVAQILQSNKRTKDIPVIFASAEKREHKFMIKGYEEGAVDYLNKPLDPDITRAKVAVLLKLQSQKKELLEKNYALVKYGLLINNSADLIGIIDAVTLKFEEVNNAFTTVLGYEREELKGSSLLFYLDDKDRGTVAKFIEQPKDRLSFETCIYCKNRTLKWLHWHVVVKDEKWFANARDITEIKQVEEIRNYLATVVKQSNDAIYLHDNEGKIISWNEGAEKIYGYSENEALQMSVWNIIPGYLQNSMQEILNSITRGEKILSLETKRITKHGKVIDVLFSATAIMDQYNNLKSIAITEQEITQQKIADEQIRQLHQDLQKNIVQLQETNKELESFSYSISHDLRAPLRALNGYAHILEEDYAAKLDEGGVRILNFIKGNSYKMSTLIDDLLNFSKLGRKEISKSTINMDELVLEVVNGLKSTANNANFKISHFPAAFADYALLRQVLINLLSNAIKYSGKKEKIEIEISCITEKDKTVYFVKDNGTGFDMQYAAKLFGVFQRLHGTEYEGTGVGLAIVHRIISKHGGRVWAESEPDKGACFYFSLPEAPSAENQPSDNNGTISNAHVVH